MLTNIWLLSNLSICMHTWQLRAAIRSHLNHRDISTIVASIHFSTGNSSINVKNHSQLPLSISYIFTHNCHWKTKQILYTRYCYHHLLLFFFEQNSLLANFNNMAWTNRNQAYFFFLLNYLPGKAFLLQTRPDCVCGHSVNSPRTCPKSRCTSINRQGVHEKCPTNRILKELSTFQKCLLFPVWK